MADWTTGAVSAAGFTFSRRPGFGRTALTAWRVAWRARYLPVRPTPIWRAVPIATAVAAFLTGAGSWARWRSTRAGGVAAEAMMAVSRRAARYIPHWRQ
ncbi:MAG: hypothetical protein FIB00_05185 [Chloroflexi bacterium]|nr:hypothetical protein [Chloroflexota bacterium]PWB71946.1 MAG: hypothetical protein C3F15_12030 [Holophagae bacterium]